MSRPFKKDGALTEDGVARVNILLKQLSDIEAIMGTASRPNGTLYLDPEGSKVFFDPSGAVRRGFAQAAIDTHRALADLGVAARDIDWALKWPGVKVDA